MKKTHTVCEKKYEQTVGCKVRVSLPGNNTSIETTNRGKQYVFI